MPSHVDVPPSWVRLSSVIILIVKTWMGTLDQSDMEGIRNYPGVAEAMLCEDNQYSAALVVFKVSTCPVPTGVSRMEAIEMAKSIAKPS